MGVLSFVGNIRNSAHPDINLSCAGSERFQAKDKRKEHTIFQEKGGINGARIIPKLWERVNGVFYKKCLMN